MIPVSAVRAEGREALHRDSRTWGNSRRDANLPPATRSYRCLVTLERCPGCHARFHPTDGPTHRYIGASAGCWDLYTRLLAGQPPLMLGGSSALLVDAYASQHPGDDSPQATQSVAVHLIVLEGVLGQGASHEDAIRMRVAAVEHGRNNQGYPKLEPVPQVWDLTIQDVVGESDAGERGEVARRYVNAVWSAWRKSHSGTMGEWYHQVRAG